MTGTTKAGLLAAILALAALSAEAQGRGPGGGNGNGNGQGGISTGAGTGLPPSCFNAGGLKEGRPECQIGEDTGGGFTDEDEGGSTVADPSTGGGDLPAVPLPPAALMTLAGIGALAALGRARRTRRD